MAKQTKQQAAVERLRELGYREAPTTSRKYIRMTNGRETLWIGNAGAVRCGATISGSFSITDAFNARRVA